jgi:hypothetical protein
MTLIKTYGKARAPAFSRGGQSEGLWGEIETGLGGPGGEPLAALTARLPN